MKKSLMNIKHFVDSNVRQRIDRAANNNCDFFDEDLLLVERQFEDIRQICIETEKRISTMLQSIQVSPLGTYTQNVQAGLTNLSQLTVPGSSNTRITVPNTTNSIDSDLHLSGTPAKLSKSSTMSAQTTFSPNQIDQQPSNNNNLQQIYSPSDKVTDPNDIRDDIQRHKKLPIVGFLKFLVKCRHKLKRDSLLATTFTHCSQLQTQLTKLYLTYEQTIEAQCLKPIHHVIEVDIPNVIKLRKLFIKSHNDLESLKTKYNGASQKQQQQQQQQPSQAGHFINAASYTITQNSTQQANINKLDTLKKELDDSETRFEQAKDSYATELYAFVCRECELVNLFKKFYQLQAEYHQQVGQTIESSLPSLGNALASTRRKVVFGAQLEEHLHCTGRQVSPVIELSIHLLNSTALDEEGLFRIPGSSVKIKKLKNAINAWFVTLASQFELDIERDSLSSLIAMRDLFKETLGQKPQQRDLAISNSSSMTGVADAVNNQTNSIPMSEFSVSSSSSNQQQAANHLIYDLHSIAGLLKLYLRELPEHLFTYALYDQWIEATTKTSTVDERLVAYEKLLRQLPKAYYDNLRHLIRFLHLLTCHSELNKMTAANLAITMAPSLIWARPETVSTSPAMIGGGSETVTGSQSSLEQGGGDSTKLDADDQVQALTMQMNNMGISASLHALVIETLISNAERLWPGQVDFNIPGFEVTTPKEPRPSGTRSQLGGKRDRLQAKSSSPTGLSTASSSSFSSSNGSVRSNDGGGGGKSNTTFKKQHDRKGGSMEGMLNINATANSIKELESARPASLTRGRPVSAFIQPTQRRLNQPPPIPPAPLARYPARNTVEVALTTARTHRLPSLGGSVRNKPPAPPVPSAKTPAMTDSNTSTVQSPIQPPRAPSRSARSNDTKGASGSGLNSVRPTVPPPDRPPKNNLAVSSHPMADDALRYTPEDSDNKSSHSITSSGNFRHDFEDISSNDVEGISVSVSPVASLESISNDDDSSFNGDDVDDEPATPESLDQSWTECEMPNVGSTVESTSHSESHDQDKDNFNAATKLAEGSSAQDRVDVQGTAQDDASKVTASHSSMQFQGNEEIIRSKTQSDSNDNSTVPTPVKPMKPPRCLSPKVTQSTPL